LKPHIFIATCALIGALIGTTWFLLIKNNDHHPSRDATVFSPDSSLSADENTQGAHTSPTDVIDPVTLLNRFSYHDGISRVAPSVVSLYTSETIYRAPESEILRDSINPRIAPAERRATSQGSGVIISPDGLIVTNNHLVASADQIFVVLSDGSLHQGVVIGADPETDLAVVSIPAGNLTAAPVIKNYSLRVGDIVLAIGNPFGVGQTVTQGIVSATRRQVAGYPKSSNMAASFVAGLVSIPTNSPCFQHLTNWSTQGRVLPTYSRAVQPKKPVCAVTM